MKTRTLIMLPLKSQSLESVGYEGGILYVKFLHGHTMSYKGVPPEQFSTLRCVPQPGLYLIQVIRLITGFIHHQAEGIAP